MKKLKINILIFLLIVLNVTIKADDPPHLPVELLYFKADVYGSIVLLRWGTATELNNYGFFVERATDEGFTTFESLGFVEGHGTSYVQWHYSFEDTTITQSGTYYYRLNQMDLDGHTKYSFVLSVDVTITSVDDNKLININYYLSQNYPNPFNPSTKIDFYINKSADVVLDIYDLLGNKIKTIVNQYLAKGNYTINVDMGEFTSGVYFYKLNVDGNNYIKKMVLQK